MEERADELVQTAIAAVAGYFAVAVGLAAVFPVFGGCVPVLPPVIARVVVTTFSEAKSAPRFPRSDPAPVPFRDPRRILMGVGAALVVQAVLIRLALAEAAAKAADEFPGAVEIGTGTAVKSLVAEKGEWDASGPNQQHHRGWLVLVWGANAPTPPEKPERGERAFATLANGKLQLARDRTSDPAGAIDLDGVDVRLCSRTPRGSNTPRVPTPGRRTASPGTDPGDGRSARGRRSAGGSACQSSSLTPSARCTRVTGWCGATRSATPRKRRGRWRCGRMSRARGP